MSTTLRIRPAMLADIPGLTDLVRQYWQFEAIPGFDAGHLARLLSELLSRPGLGRIWVAESGRQLAGYLAAVLVFSLEHRGLMAEIDEFFLVPTARGQDVGAAMLAAAEADLAREGCVRVQLQLGKENSGARAFYRRYGYAGRSGYELLDKPLAGY